MKTRICLILCGLLMGLTAMPQETRKPLTFGYYNRTEAGISFGVGNFKTDIYDGIQKHIKNDEIVISLQTINGITYKGRTGIGIGVGVEKWQHGWFIPVFGQLYYDFKPKDNTFFGTLSLGKAIGTRDSTTFYREGDGGFMAQIGIGYKMKVANRLRFYYEVFYTYQAILSSYRNYVTIDSVVRYSTIEYKVPLSFLGFRIGITFY